MGQDTKRVLQQSEVSGSVYVFVFFLILVNGKVMPQSFSDLHLLGVCSHLRLSR